VRTAGGTPPARGGLTGGDEDRYHPGSESMATAGTLTDPLAPSAPRRPRTVTEPAREIPVHAVTEVLVERANHLGGLSTGGLVIWIDRMTDWHGRLVIAGIGSELLQRLPEGAVAGAPRSEWGSTETDHVGHWRERQGAFRNTVTWSPMIDPEWLKYLSAEILVAEGVSLLFHSLGGRAAARGADGDGGRL